MSKYRKNCQQCDKEFDTGRSRQVYCSLACARRHRSPRNHKEISLIGLTLAEKLEKLKGIRPVPLTITLKFKNKPEPKRLNLMQIAAIIRDQNK